ncbi:MAG TPA: carboxypeptidase regulatory-like domain-containing protein [Gemmatimonadales bacterium]
MKTIRTAVAHRALTRARAGALLPHSLLAATVLLAACSNDEAGGSTVRSARAEPPPPPVIAVPATPYREVRVVDDGWVAGSVRVAGDVPADTVVTPTMDQRVCGTRVTDRSVRLNRDRLADVVVWLTDIRTGKQLPLERRFVVTNEKCLLEPRVQAAVAGGTLNVRSADRLEHRTRISRHGGEALTVIQQNDFGQVVPDDRVLSRPGLLDLTSDVHPWTRAYVAVFDHPYFAVTGRDGAFQIDEIPPGSYTLAAWHERFGKKELPVTVRAGDRTVVEVVFGEDSVVAGGG